MKLRTAFLAAVLPLQLAISAEAATPSAAPSFIIDGEEVHFHGARVSENRPGRRSGESVPVSDRELRVSVTAQDFPTLPGAIGGMRWVEIVLSDGQTIRGKSEGLSWGGKDPVVWDLASFPIVPWREKQLLLRFEYAGQHYEFPFANPGYREDVPEWQSQDYPVTWKQGDLEVTLEGLQLVGNEKKRYIGFGLELKPKWSIRWKGRPAINAFHVRSWVEDAGGNRSAEGGLLGVSAWRLHCTISRSSEYPFEEDEVRWFGWTKADRFKTIPGGECDLLEIDGFGRESGILFAGLFGPGMYEFEDGQLVRKAPPGDEGRAKFFNSEFEEATGKIRLTVDRPVFVKQVGKIRSGWGETYLDPEGKPVHLGGGGSEAGRSRIWRQDLEAARGKSFQYGLAKSGEPTRFEMFVRPPTLPRK